MAKKFLTNIDLQKNQLQNSAMHPLASAPSSPVEGQVYYNTTGGNKKLYLWNGTEWVDLTQQTGAPSFAAPANEIAAGVAAAAGVATSSLRSDAKFKIKTATAVSINGANNEGSSESLARADHTHAYGAESIETAAIKAANVTLAKLASDVTTYINDRAGGFDWHGSCRAKTTTNITIATPGTTFDGIALATNDRLLVTNQTTKKENGIYVFKGSATPLERVADANEVGELSGGSSVYVEEGTEFADSIWSITTNGSITPGTTEMEWTQTSGLGQIVAGSGLTKTGNTLNAVGTANRILVEPDNIDIAATYVGQTSITTLGTIGTGTWQGTKIAVAGGGTGATTAAEARTNLGGLTRKFAANVGNASSTSIEVEHLLASVDVLVMVHNVSSGEMVECDITITNENKVTLGFAVAPGTNELRVVVVG